MKDADEHDKEQNFQMFLLLLLWLSETFLHEMVSFFGKHSYLSQVWCEWVGAKQARNVLSSIPFCKGSLAYTQQLSELISEGEKHLSGNLSLSLFILQNTDCSSVKRTD